MTTIDAAVGLLVEARRTQQPALAARTHLPDTPSAYAVQDGVAREFGWFTDAPARGSRRLGQERSGSGRHRQSGDGPHSE